MTFIIQKSRLSKHHIMWEDLSECECIRSSSYMALIHADHLFISAFWIGHMEWHGKPTFINISVSELCFRQFSIKRWKLWPKLMSHIINQIFMCSKKKTFSIFGWFFFLILIPTKIWPNRRKFDFCDNLRFILWWFVFIQFVVKLCTDCDVPCEIEFIRFAI